MKRLFLITTTLLLLAFAGRAQTLDPAIEARVDGLLKRMTLEEKITLLGGVNFFQVPGAPRVGLPVLTTADSPFGVRFNSRSTLYAGGINLAATFNERLAREIGLQLGRDARARGVHFNLGPGVNIYRSPLNGRNFEYFGEDPFLASRMAVGYIDGLQSQGVSATIKHFLANNSEFDRHDSDSVVDERTLREIYLPAFEAAVKEAKTGAIMDSYNLVNGAHATQNGRFNIDLLRNEWGFTGVVMSDWDSTYDTLGAANGGLDLEMPFGKFLNLRALKPLLDSGKVTAATIDEKARRILRLAARMGWLDRPQKDAAQPLYNQAGREASRQAAREGMVLLKNDGNLLPFDRTKLRKIAVIGPNAYPTAKLGGGSATIVPFDSVSFLDGIAAKFGGSGSTLYAEGLPTVAKAVAATAFTLAADGKTPGIRFERFDNPNLEGAPSLTKTERAVRIGAPLDLGAMATGEFDPGSVGGFATKPFSNRWTGYYTAKTAGQHDLFVQVSWSDEAGYRVFVDDRLVADRWRQTRAMLENFALDLTAGPHKIVIESHGLPGFFEPMLRAGIVARGAWIDPAAVELAKNADAVVLAVGFDSLSEGEGKDRTFALPPGQEELIRAVTAVNKNTVVVVTAGGGVEMDGWLGGARGVVQSWYAGQEGGTALGEILFGEVDPSGRLPISIERRAEDNPSFNYYYETPGTNRIEYKEGIFVGYRGYEKNNVRPLFPFGYGLSYTTFKYGNLAVKPLGGDKYEVSFDVTNTGTRAGAAVPQLYIGERNPTVPRPVKELKGFSKISLAPGRTARLTIPLDFRSFAFYDTASKSWKANPGKYDILIGASSADIVLKGEIGR
ncbi:MAG: glycoside hydrolase family 3 C-terminal domain-containing protein [Acidobacteria bacterium]|nr:glycoside hydrolase family 3 C-terminal domain-containing protein [Acidobacteriota bacterium]